MSANNELDIEAGLEKLPVAIQSMEDLITKELPNVSDLMSEVAKDSGVPQLERSVAAFIETAASLRESLQGFLGESGDTLSSEGSMYSALSFIKKAQETLG